MGLKVAGAGAGAVVEAEAEAVEASVAVEEVLVVKTQHKIPVCMRTILALPMALHEAEVPLLWKVSRCVGQYIFSGVRFPAQG